MKIKVSDRRSLLQARVGPGSMRVHLVDIASTRFYERVIAFSRKEGERRWKLP